MLGEGTLWSVRHQALYWVDILGHQLHRYHPATQARDSWATGTLSNKRLWLQFAAQLMAEPLAGALFSVEIDSPGLPAFTFGKP